MSIENILYVNHTINSYADFFTAPYQIGFDLFKETFSPLKEKSFINLIGRVGVFCLALLLSIPVINYVALLAINIFAPSLSNSGAGFNNAAPWLDNFQMQDYFDGLRKRRFPNRLAYTISGAGENHERAGVTNCSPNNILEYFVRPYFQRLDPATPRELLIPFFMHVSGNHWTLVVINRETRTVAYYDSKANYGDRNLIDRSLEAVRDELNILDPSRDGAYVYQRKITKSLQPDVNMCGYWVCYFLEEILENQNIDFNALDHREAQIIIADFAKRNFPSSRV